MGWLLTWLAFYLVFGFILTGVILVSYVHIEARWPPKRELLKTSSIIILFWPFVLVSILWRGSKWLIVAFKNRNP